MHVKHIIPYLKVNHLPEDEPSGSKTCKRYRKLEYYFRKSVFFWFIYIYIYISIYICIIILKSKVQKT